MATILQSRSENIKYEELSLALLNIMGLRDKTHEVRHIIARDKLHVVALCETKLNTDVKESEVYIPGFSMWRTDGDSSGGGVALYVQDHIKTRLRPNLMNPEAEIIWVEMELPARPVLLGCCYRPAKDKTTYLKHITKTIQLLSEKEKDKDIFLMGNFNIDWLSDSETKEADFLISKLGWNQIVKDATSVTVDSERCTDHIYTNISDNLEPNAIPTGCSDHNLLTVVTDRKIPQSKQRFISILFNQEKIQKDMKEKLTKVYKESGAAKALKELIKILSSDKTTKQMEKNIYDSLKLNDELKLFITKRDKKKKDIISDVSQFIKEKKTLEDKIKGHVQGKSQCKPEGGDNEGRPEQRSGKTLPCDENNLSQVTSVTSEEEHPTLSSSETTDSESGSERSQSQQRTGKCSFRETDDVTVKTWLQYLCENVVELIDKTEAELMKDVADHISAPIRDILNQCIMSAKIPKEQKKIQISQASAHHCNIRQSKGADRVYVMLSYVFDAILYEQAKLFFIEEGKKSIETLKNNLGEANRAVGAVLLDFTSSFDDISHDELITTLDSLMVFSESALKLIKSFLCGQKDSSGLPRGSCLAQLLRIVIINDLQETLAPSAVICNSYMMICAHGDPETTETELDNKMKIVEKWAKKLKLSFQTRRKQFEPSELPAMLKILKSMLLCHGDESNWIRAPGNVVKQNGDWKYDNVSKELELHFGSDSQ
ncbi:PREDICTED: uncharacterized protein LOC106911663 [Poecilia mexicana]|uniref:uncharacterized protein LOC106911663 n=1 Tax=Poecilia mexicana TaxID=48701 RepID=UPI00072E7BE5|nr:PREDICTED: uncharacterized protein LOC106911663 [Poecilia mexicana]XP_014833952.1 PREDICTED: uncharacterized protein LOC106911663 [Poecilia mexicana]